jgi:hypothetical protein
MPLVESLQAIVAFCIQLFVIFPYSALTIPRHGPPRIGISAANMEDFSDDLEDDDLVMGSDKVYNLCTSGESVSKLLAEDPALAPGDAWNKLYGHLPNTRGHGKLKNRIDSKATTPEDLKRVAECGNWGPTQPNDLFLKARSSITP